MRQGSRIRGKVSRVADFGAFVELEPGIEGLIHVSEMSWTRKNVRAADVVKPGDMVEVVVLGVNGADKRIALGLKQALGDPWEEALKKYPVGAAVEAPVTSLAKFGAFVDLGDGIEGMIHIGDISHEKRLNHPSDALKVGEIVKAQVLEADKERRRLRLGIKQLVPTSIDEYIAEHKPGDGVSGRVVDVSATRAKVELGEGRDGELQTGRGEDRRSLCKCLKSGHFLAFGDAGAEVEVGTKRAFQSQRGARRRGPVLQDHQLGCRSKAHRAGTGLAEPRDVTFHPAHRPMEWCNHP